jgi:RNA polymerase sigma factor (sigma-70 family)
VNETTCQSNRNPLEAAIIPLFANLAASQYRAPSDEQLTPFWNALAKLANACVHGCAWGHPLADRDDLAQEVILRAFNHWKHIQNQSRTLEPAAASEWLHNWLRTISRNLVRDAVRRAKTRSKRQATNCILEAVADPHVATEVVGAGVGAQELELQLNRAIELLPLRQREVLVAYVNSGGDYSAVSAQLNVPEKTLRALVSQARKRIRDRLYGEPGS